MVQPLSVLVHQHDPAYLPFGVKVKDYNSQNHRNLILLTSEPSSCHDFVPTLAFCGYHGNLTKSLWCVSGAPQLLAVCQLVSSTCRKQTTDLSSALMSLWYIQLFWTWLAFSKSQLATQMRVKSESTERIRWTDWNIRISFSQTRHTSSIGVAGRSCDAFWTCEESWSDCENNTETGVCRQFRVTSSTRSCSHRPSATAEVILCVGTTLKTA